MDGNGEKTRKWQSVKRRTMRNIAGGLKVKRKLKAGEEEVKVKRKDAYCKRW